MTKVRQDNTVINKAIFLALGINLDGRKELLGMWIAENEGAKFWLGVLTELQNRGVQDILIACVDGLKGFPDAINSVYPQTQIQLCIVHMVRNSLKYVSRKDYKAVTAELKTVYQSTTEELGLQALEKFAEKWDGQYPQISKSWRNHWHNRPTPRKCLHYYFYFIDAELGLIYLRVPTWCPFRLQFYCNGHSWLARQLAAASIGYVMADNAFIRIDDWERAQQLADSLSPDMLHRILDRYANECCPILDVFVQTYHWSLMQVEVFDRSGFPF